jgi:hypothetical protein
MSGIASQDNQILAALNGNTKRLVRHYSISELEQELGPHRLHLATPPSVAPDDWDMIQRYRDSLYQQFHASMGSSEDVMADVCGIDYDMGEMLAGNPECWQSIQIADAPVYHIAVNPSSHFTSNLRTLVMRGAALCAIIDLLESRGSRMSIEYCYGESFAGTPRKTDRWHYRLVLKQPDQPLDMRRIADWIAGTIISPEHQEAFFGQTTTNPTTHGIHLTTALALNRGIYIAPAYQFHNSPELNGEFDIAMDRIESYWTEEFAENWIRQQVEQLSNREHAALAR